MFRKLICLFLLAYGAAVLSGPVMAWAQGEPPAARQADPSGANTGNAADVPAATPGVPTMEELASAVGHNKVAINMMWVLITGFLVMFMQAGFAMVETGFTRAKNVAHTMAMNLTSRLFPINLRNRSTKGR